MIRMPMEIMISHAGTVVMAILVNMTIGEVNGMYEHTLMKVLSRLPDDMENMAIMKQMTRIMVIGVMAVPRSSMRDTVEPIAPNRKA